MSCVGVGGGCTACHVWVWVGAVLHVMCGGGWGLYCVSCVGGGGGCTACHVRVGVGGGPTPMASLSASPAGSAALFRLCAHDKATCGMSICPTVPTLLATSSTDKRVKLWDIANNQPTLVAHEDLQARRGGGGAPSIDIEYDYMTTV